MINSNCNNCNNCNAVTRLPSLQPPLLSPRPILSCPLPCAALRLLPGRSAVPKLPSAMGNGGAILELLAATTSVFNITDEEALEVVVNETDKLARIYELYRYKMAS